MKSSEIPDRTAIPLPFSLNGEAHVYIPDIDPSGEGFSLDYQRNNGKPKKFITRCLMNKLLGQMSGNQFIRQCGALNVFDQKVCDAIDGYPQGAVLQYLDNNVLYDVVSTRDQNDTNYTKVGVDGIDWQFYGSSIFSYVYPDYGTTGTGNVTSISVAANTNGIVKNSSNNPIVVKIPKTCYIQVYLSNTLINSQVSQCGVILYGSTTSAPSTIPDDFDGRFLQYELTEGGSVACPILPVVGGTKISAFSVYDGDSVDAYSIKIRFLTPTRTR